MDHHQKRMLLINTKDPTGGTLRETLHDAGVCDLRRQPRKMHILEVRKRRMLQDSIQVTPFQRIAHVIVIREIQLERHIFQA